MTITRNYLIYKSMLSFYIKDFGCKVNQCEGESIRKILSDNGLSECSSVNDCDILIINGCAVTSRAEQKAKQFIGKFKKTNQNLKEILTGCLASLYSKKKGRYQIDYDIIINQSDKGSKLLTDLCENLKQDVSAIWAPLPVMPNHTRTFVKIQDGCSHFCSYCIVPFMRLNEISRPLNDILKTISNAINKDIAEIVLVGIRIGNWSYNNLRLLDLLKSIVEKFPQIRLRLSSLEPWELSYELIDFISQSPNIARHLHIPLQSGSNDILKKMRREYTTSEFNEKVIYAHSKIENLSLGTDIIVGFPGETEIDFAKTVEFYKSNPFSYAHIFRYSDRPFTKSSEMENKIPGAVIKNRAEILAELDKQRREEFISSYIGKPVDVLFERKSMGYWKGYSSNYIQCFLKSEDKLKGKIISLTAYGTFEKGLRCR